MRPFILKYRLTQKYKSAGEGGPKKNIFSFGGGPKTFSKSPRISLRTFLSFIRTFVCLFMINYYYLYLIMVLNIFIFYIFF